MTEIQKPKTILRVMKRERDYCDSCQAFGDACICAEDRILQFSRDRSKVSLDFSNSDMYTWKVLQCVGAGTYTNNFATDATSSVAGSGSIGNSINVSLLNSVARGTLNSNRIGRRISMRALHISGSVNAASVMTVASTCTLVLVYDARPNRTATLNILSDIFSSTTISGCVEAITYDRRFTVLKEWKFSYPIRSATLEPEAVIIPFEDVIYLGGLPLVYTDADSGGAFPAVLIGNLLLCCKGTTTIAQGAAGISILANLYFTDE